MQANVDSPAVEIHRSSAEHQAIQLPGNGEMPRHSRGGTRRRILKALASNFDRFVESWRKSWIAWLVS